MKTNSNLLGVHALVWVGGWTKDECREAIKNTVEAGYGLIEIPALDPKSIDTEHTKATLDEFGLKVACSLGLTFDADINNEDIEIVNIDKMGPGSSRSNVSDDKRVTNFYMDINDPAVLTLFKNYKPTYSIIRVY